MDRPKVVKQRRQDVVAKHLVQQRALQDVADRSHHRHDQDQRAQRRQAELFDRDERDEGGENAEVAMGDIDEAHHAESQRQPRGEQGVEAAEHQALQERVRPGGDHGSDSEISGGNGVATEIGRLALQADASALKAIDVVGHGQRLADVLLDDDHGEALRQQVGNGGVNIAG